MKISVAIPTWESHGRGEEFLDDLLRTIEIQSFKDFEVVISDHSVNDNLSEVIEKFKDKFEIVYFKNENDKGNGPFNTNTAISKCSGEIIKIMFQDDFFYDDEALKKIHNCFNADVKWLLCGSNHTNDDGYNFYWDLYPKWNDDILKGINTVGSPSSLAIKREVFQKVKFDENLVMMMDCDFYYHIKEIYGNPIYLNDILVSNRVHSKQISQQLYHNDNYEEKIQKEINYCIQKYNCN
jgi:glycosyltransferase involved in cell wall biosynthesis